LIFEPVAVLLAAATPCAAALISLWPASFAAATGTAIAAIAQGPLGLGGTPAEGVLRVQAWYPSANHLALMLGRAWPFLVAAALGRLALAVGLPAAIVGLALVLTFSTGGWVGAAVGGLIVLAVMGKAAPGKLGWAVFAVAGPGSWSAAWRSSGSYPKRLNPLRS